MQDGTIIEAISGERFVIVDGVAVPVASDAPAEREPIERPTIREQDRKPATPKGTKKASPKASPKRDAATREKKARKPFVLPTGEQAEAWKAEPASYRQISALVIRCHWTRAKAEKASKYEAAKAISESMERAAK